MRGQDFPMPQASAKTLRTPLNGVSFGALVISAACLLVPGLGARDCLAGAPTLGAPANKTYAQTRTYKFTVHHYDPRVEIDTEAPVETPLGTPEKVLIAQLVSMSEGDFDAWLATWDTESQAAILAGIEDGAYSEASLRAAWTSRFEGKSVFLTRWIDFEDAVLLEYEVENQDSPPVVAGQFRVGFQYSDEGWRGNQTVNSRPVANAIATGIYETNRTVR